MSHGRVSDRYNSRLSTQTINLERIIQRLTGRKDIENALGELENVIQGEHYTVTAQVLHDTGELRRGEQPYRLGTHFSLSLVTEMYNRWQTREEKKSVCDPLPLLPLVETETFPQGRRYERTLKNGSLPRTHR